MMLASLPLAAANPERSGPERSDIVRAARRPGLFALACAPSALALALGFATPALADIKAGVDAWAKGDFATAVHEWEGPAAKGDADAQFDLGQAYKLGRGVKQDLAKAETLFGEAAAKGHLQAADNYGLLLFQRGEHERAMPYVTGAAGRGDPRAEYLLGIAHFNGDGVPKDWVRAYALESLAQQSGLQQAKVALAQMDKFIPLDQRQQAVSLEADLNQQIEATRNRQSATSELGGTPSQSYTPAAGPQLAGPQDTGSQDSGPRPVPAAPSAYTPPQSYASQSTAPMGSSAAYAPPPYTPPSYTPAPSAPNRDPYSGFAGPSPQSEAASQPLAQNLAQRPDMAPSHPMGLPQSAPRPRFAAAHPHASPAMAPAPAPVAAPAPDAGPDGDTAPAATATPAHAHMASSGPWKVQLGAFGVAANAELMWGKVKSRPEISGHPRALVPTGRVSRLLATGYSEEGAHAACHKLTAEGIACLVTKD